MKKYVSERTAICIITIKKLFYRTIYHCYLTPEKLSERHKGNINKKGHFIMPCGLWYHAEAIIAFKNHRKSI